MLLLLGWLVFVAGIVCSCCLVTCFLWLGWFVGIAGLVGFVAGLVGLCCWHALCLLIGSLVSVAELLTKCPALQVALRVRGTLLFVVIVHVS